MLIRRTLVAGQEEYFCEFFRGWLEDKGESSVNLRGVPWSPGGTAVYGRFRGVQELAWKRGLGTMKTASDGESSPSTLQATLIPNKPTISYNVRL
jgi:hypothetical protein